MAIQSLQMKYYEISIVMKALGFHLLVVVVVLGRRKRVPYSRTLTVVLSGYIFNDPTGLWSHVAGLN